MIHRRFRKRLCSLLPSPVWPLRICLESCIWHSRSYVILLFTASDFTSIIGHIHNWVLFMLWFQLFSLSGVISPLISSSILGYQPGEFIFHTVHGFSRQECWSGLSFPSPVDHILSEFSTMTCPSWVALHSTVHSFIKLDKVWKGRGTRDQTANIRWII